MSEETSASPHMYVPPSDNSDSTETEDTSSVVVPGSEQEPSHGDTNEGTSERDRMVQKAEAARRKIKYKANGQEFEREIDVNSDDELARYISMAHAGQEAMRQRSEMEKLREADARKLNDILLAAQGNPRQMLEHFGIDFAKFVEDNYIANVQEAMLTPEQRQQRQEQQELNRYREERQRAEHEAHQRQVQEQQNASNQRLVSSVQSAMESAELPDNQVLRQTILGKALEAIHYDLLNARATGRNPMLTPAQAVRKARDHYMKPFKETAVALMGDKFYDFLGEDVVKKLRQEDLKRLRKGAPPARNAAPGTGRIVPKQEEPRQKYSLDDLKGRRFND